MKANHFILLTAMLVCTIACVNKNSGEPVSGVVSKEDILIADTFETGKVIKNIICKTGTGQSYALYIPVKKNEAALPVVYFFDPHGDGSFPLSKYTALADEYGFILIGSNNSKNGIDWIENEHIWTTLFGDSQERLNINASRVYTCGFSGGARVAAYIALHHDEIKGVIANGAGLPEITSAGNFKFSFTAIAGEGDMNMTELAGITKALDQTQTRHRIIFFNGMHEWAPASTMYVAFAGLQLDAMHEGSMQQDELFINTYIAGNKKTIADYVQTKNFVKAENECSLSVEMLNGLTKNVNWFIKEDAELKNNTAYQKQSQAAVTLLQEETKIKNVYNEQFQIGSDDYWIKTIIAVRSKSKALTTEGAMYQRLISYLSLAFYSITNRLTNLGQNAKAKHFVDLYKLADPSNSEAWYLSAVLNARNKNVTATQSDLLKAIALGFADKNRMVQQTEFLIPGLHIKDIESKMK